MHEVSIPYIDTKNIGYLINGFITEITNKYGPTLELNMLIAGGSAIVIKHKFRSTVDIDTDIKCNHAVKGSINKAAEKLGVPSDFMNEDFTKSNSYSRKLWDNAIHIKSYGRNINIYVVDDIDQLCMKIVSGRPKDDADIRMLTEKLKERGVKAVLVNNRLNELYGGRVSFSRKALSYVSRRLR